MDSPKQVLILIVCALQVYAQTPAPAPVDIKQGFTQLLIGIMKEMAPVRQAYINEVKNGDHKPDGGLKYIQFLQSQEPVYNEFSDNIDKLIENIESNNPGYQIDEVDNTLVNTFRGVTQELTAFYNPLKNVQTSDFREIISQLLESFMAPPTLLEEDYGNPALKYLNDHQLAFKKYKTDLGEIEGLDTDEKFERMEEIMADVSLDIDKLDREFIDLNDILD